MNNDYISTRKKRIKYKFVQPNAQQESEESADFSFFYQICTFPDPYTKKFHMRKFIINHRNEFANVKEFNLSKKQCKKFFAIKKQHEYKCYPVYSLENINYPNLGEILGSKSDILNNEYDYTGFAPFN